MNEKLEGQLAKVIEKSLEIAEKTGEFVIDQAPELLREFYMWHTVSAIIEIILCLFVFYVLKRIGRSISLSENPDSRWYKKIFGRWYETDESPFIFYSSVGGTAFIIFFVVLIYNTMKLIKILVAPKLYLIEYFIN